MNIEILNNPDDIIKYLQIGINIPILPQFKKYIFGDLKAYKAKSIILKESIENNLLDDIDNVVGNVLVYEEDTDTLFFGYFGTYDHKPEKIDFLIDNLINYGKEKGYARIRGPINIPTIIFGWGFMKEGSDKRLFISRPVNPPIYQERFLKKGFSVKFEELSFEGPSLKINPYKIKKKDGTFNDYSNYEFGTLDREDMLKFKDDFIRLHKENLPQDSQITPKSDRNFDNYLDFIYTFGQKYMMYIVKYKPTDIIVACGYSLPNIFSCDKKGRIDSVSFHSWVIDKKHRNKGLALLMYGEFSLQAFPPIGSIKWGSGPIGSKNIRHLEIWRKVPGFKINRSHLIMEKEF